MTVQSVVHVIDDDAEFRKSATRLLRLSGYEAFQYETAQQFIDQWKTDTPGCILLDLDMPKINGLQLLERLHELHAALPVIFLSGRGDIRSSVKAIKAGAQDFLCKPASRKELVTVIEQALSRNHETIESHARLEDFRSRVNALTPREKQVFASVVGGKLNKQVAHALSISERTIKAHRQKVMHKLKVHSVVELVSFAERLNALEAAE